MEIYLNLLWDSSHLNKHATFLICDIAIVVVKVYHVWPCVNRGTIHPQYTAQSQKVPTVICALRNEIHVCGMYFTSSPRNMGLTKI